MSQIANLQQMIEDVRIHPSFQPEDDPTPEEAVIGELTVELKKIYILRYQTDQEIRDIVADSISSRRDPFVNPETMRVLKKSKALKELLDELLWYTITEEFDLWDVKSGGLGVRNGWKVVTFEAPDTDILRLLSNFF